MEYSDLYNKSDLLIMKNAEDSKNRNNNRIQEIIEYAKTAKIQKIGIAYCTNFTKQAKNLETLLQNEGFTIAKVHCKYGRMPFSNLIEGYKGVSCNPAGQAKYLEEEKTQLNIVMGLCLGHDMIFNGKSAAPATTLIVKERKDNVSNILNKKIMDKSLVLNTIKIVEHPAIDLTLHELGIVSNIEINDKEVNVTFSFPFPNIPIADNLINSVAIPVKNLGFEFKHRIEIMNDQQRHHFLELEKQAWRG